MNVVQFGPEIYGVKDAAQFYFKKDVSELHLLDATFLAFVLPNPDIYWKSYKNGALSPFAQKIIRIILNRMVTFKTITPDAYQLALNELNHFPWHNLTRADFQNAHFDNVAIGDESSQDSNALDQFLGEDQQEEERGGNPTLAAPAQKPKKVAQPSQEESAPTDDENSPADEPTE